MKHLEMKVKERIMIPLELLATSKINISSNTEIVLLVVDLEIKEDLI